MSTNTSPSNTIPSPIHPIQSTSNQHTSSGPSASEADAGYVTSRQSQSIAYPANNIRCTISTRTNTNCRMRIDSRSSINCCLCSIITGSCNTKQCSRYNSNLINSSCCSAYCTPSTRSSSMTIHHIIYTLSARIYHDQKHDILLNVE